MKPTIDEQLEAEALLKTKRLQELIREIVAETLREELKHMLGDPAVVYSIYPVTLGAALAPVVVTHPAFRDAVNSAIRQAFPQHYTRGTGPIWVSETWR